MIELYYNCKTIVLQQLEKIGNIKTLNDISDLPDKVEQEAKKILKGIILQKPANYFNVFDTNCRFIDYLVFENKRFSIKYVPNVINPEELILEILQSDFEKIDMIDECEIKISGYGKYSKVHIFVSSQLKVQNENLMTAVKTVFETSYKWFGIKTEDFVCRETVSVANKVYSFLRTIICNDTLYKSLWIAVVGKGYGFRLVNREQVNELFCTFAENKDLSVSVIDCVSNLLSTKLPYDELLMKAALDYNQSIDGDISNAKYSKNGNRYSKTMYSLYGGNAFSIYPIMQDEIGIVALYPVEYKEEIKKHLDSSRLKISQLIKHEMSNIELAYLLFDDDFQSHFNEGFEYTAFFDENIDQLLDIALIIIEKYYKIYSQLGKDFVFSGLQVTNQKERQCLDLLEKNGLIKCENNCYSITDKGIVFYEEKKKGEQKMDLSNNQGIINFGSMGDAINRVNYKDGQINNYIESIKETVKNTDEADYVSTLLGLLEKEIQKNEPKPNIIQKILSSLSAIPPIVSLVEKLKTLLCS